MKGRMSIMTRLWTHPSFSSSNHREPCVCRRSDLRSGRAEGMSLMSVMQHAGQSHNSHFSEGKLHRAFFSINPWRTADAALRDEPTGHSLSSAQKHTHTRWQNTKKKGALHEYCTILFNIPYCFGSTRATERVMRMPAIPIIFRKFCLWVYMEMKTIAISKRCTWRPVFKSLFSVP